jgi:hypothetical protein
MALQQLLFTETNMSDPIVRSPVLPGQPPFPGIEMFLPAPQTGTPLWEWTQSSLDGLDFDDDYKPKPRRFSLHPRPVRRSHKANEEAKDD